MGFLGIHKNASDPDDGLVSDGIESEACTYVREIIMYCVSNKIKRFSITNNNGFALCEHSQMQTPFNQVRNRVSVMTDSIVHYKTQLEQTGVIECIVHGVKYHIGVVDRINKSGIDFTLNPVES
jgi:hypothetical protein